MDRCKLHPKAICNVDETSQKSEKRKAPQNVTEQWQSADEYLCLECLQQWSCSKPGESASAAKDGLMKDARASIMSIFICVITAAS